MMGKITGLCDHKEQPKCEVYFGGKSFKRTRLAGILNVSRYIMFLPHLPLNKQIHRGKSCVHKTYFMILLYFQIEIPKSDLTRLDNISSLVSNKTANQLIAYPGSDCLN